MCVPKKLFVYGSEFSHDVKGAAGFGWDVSGSPTVDWPRLIDNKDTEIGRLNGIYGTMLGGAGVTVLESRATIEDPHTVNVDGQYVSCVCVCVCCMSSG